MSGTAVALVRDHGGHATWPKKRKSPKRKRKRKTTFSVTPKSRRAPRQKRKKALSATAKKRPPRSSGKRTDRYYLQRDQPAPDAAPNGVRAVLRAELRENRGDVKLHRVFGDAEARGDRFVRQTFAERLEH